ncbi:major facilitator superfamily domain-containing protein [Lasiosphaeria miniovina]|uniref:Major facilitator superfamily domain-containing protein n=1 Tax=Lasiosphaeria miniovina TaxID=1954250 RepID=A0AA40DVT1_9PEZI|nr:major facilitator superfamily domain-containing protein [Lasiosphaeria miniovina]KAK0713568.1 major facilitator superfamily domain-containing protein [Lasiosphaeria miniovina]
MDKQSEAADAAPPTPQSERNPEAGKGDAVPGPKYLAGTKLVLVMVAIILACFLMLLDTSVVSTAVPQITTDFHSLTDVGWYASAYTLGSAAFQPLTGKIFSVFSLKWSWLTFFAVFEIGSVLCGAATSSNMLIVGRAIAGAGASGLLSGAINIVSSSVPIERRPALIGMVMGIAQLGTVLGPVIGGAFTSGYTWRWSFYINLPLGALVAGPITLVHIPDQTAKPKAWSVLPRIHHHLDLFGFALFAPAVIQLLLALQYGGNQFAWNSSQVIGLFVGAGATFIVWAFWNYRKGDDALLPVSIIRRRTIWASALNYGFLMSTLLGVSYFLPIYFQAVKDLNAVLSGVNLLPTIFPQLVFAIGSGVLVTKIGRIPPFSIFSGMLVSIATGLFSTLQEDTSLGKRVGYQILMGVGLGSGLQMPIVATQNSVSPKELTAAMAFIVWAQYMGPSIFLVLYNVVFDASLRNLLPHDAPGVSTEAVISAGARRFRDIVSPEDLPGVLKAYSDSVDRVFYLVAGVGVVVFLSAFGMGFKDIRKKDGGAAAAAAAAPAPSEKEAPRDSEAASAVPASRANREASKEHGPGGSDSGDLSG